MNAAGETTTDYSYQFSKRFLNDRVRFVIGGKVSSSADATEATQSFIDNIAIEYLSTRPTIVTFVSSMIAIPTMHSKER